MARAKQVLLDNQEGHHRLAELLIEKEVITHEDVEAILGPRQWKSRGDEIIADNQNKEAEKSDEQILAEAKALYEAEQQAQNSDSPSEPDTEQPEQDDKQA